MPDELWLLAAYTSGTIFGLAVGYFSGLRSALDTAIDALIAKDIIKTKKREDGTIEILKYYEE